MNGEQPDRSTFHLNRASLAKQISASEPMRDVRPEVFPAHGQWRHFWSLTITLTRGELKQRYFGSILGYAWTLLRPLMLFGVLYFVFTQIIFRDGTNVPHYSVILLTSLVLWTYFAETSTVAVTSLVAKENMMRKIRFPRLAVPLSSSLTTGFHLILNLAVILVFLLANGIRPQMGWLFAPFLITILVVFTFGVSLLLSTIYVKLRDVGSIWDVLVQLLFWASPVIYTIEFPNNPTVRAIIASNPVSTVLIEMRRAVVDPAAPSAVEALGGETWYLIAPIGIFLAVCGLGLYLFNRLAPGLAEEL